MKEQFVVKYIDEIPCVRMPPFRAVTPQILKEMPYPFLAIEITEILRKYTNKDKHFQNKTNWLRENLTAEEAFNLMMMDQPALEDYVLLFIEEILAEREQ